MQIFAGYKSIKRLTFTHGITEKSKHSQENLQPPRIRNMEMKWGFSHELFTRNTLCKVKGEENKDS